VWTPCTCHHNVDSLAVPFYAQAEVKGGNTLLPMPDTELFTSCKKVRDDRGYWNQIEVYIRDHSEAEFSHGICPDCMKKLYGDILEEEDISRKQ